VLLLHHRELDREKALDKLIHAWIDHLALALLEGVAGKPRLVVVCGTDDSRFDFRLAPVQASTAREILSVLATDLLTGDHDDRLPCVAVFEACKPRCSLEGLTPTMLERALRGTASGKGDACRWGSVPSPMEYPLAEAQSAFDRVKRRFGPLFAHLSEVKT
jgi:hypothetical protein